MKLIHLSDLHLGKSIYGVSMLENGDQDYWADQFLEFAKRENPDAILIAGDVYDRASPSGEAVQLLSRMLTTLSEYKIPVLMVAGNHDSVQRLSFASPLLAKQHLYISRPMFETAELESVCLEDEYGPVTFWLMPYVYPSLIAKVLDDESLHDSDTAVRALLAKQNIDFSQRNVLIAHQNVTANGVEAIRGGSESMIGGVGQIDFTAFDGFDYVALGHIHSAGYVGRETVRYAGTPLYYHFDELKQAEKGPILVELGTKSEPVRMKLEQIPPLHPMRELRGSLEQLRSNELAFTRTGEYLRLVLTDCRLSPEISAFFDELFSSRRSILMERCSEYTPYHMIINAATSQIVEQKSIEELFESFYAERNGGVLPDKQDSELLTFAGELSLHADVHAEPTDNEIEKILNYLTKQEETI